jgi:hypothetical protein
MMSREPSLTSSVGAAAVIRQNAAAAMMAVGFIQLLRTSRRAVAAGMIRELVS